MYDFIYNSFVLYRPHLCHSRCRALYFCGGVCVMGVAVSRMKYVHCPSTGFSSKSSHLYPCISKGSKKSSSATYTFDLRITSTSFNSPSATWITSSISPAPILFSISSILFYLSVLSPKDISCILDVYKENSEVHLNAKAIVIHGS